jgi:hypothetical protein
MIGLFSAVLLAAAATFQPPQITIDSCVAVDPAEVRRLAAVELDTGNGATTPASYVVIVGCQDTSQYLRLIDTKRGLIASRTIDLSASREENRDARVRELALAIAELLRRAELTPGAAAPAAANSAPQDSAPQSIEETAPTDSGEVLESPGGATQVAATQPISPPTSDRAKPGQTPDGPRPWLAELGVTAVAVSWTEGQALFGADLTGRVHLGRWLIAELRTGGRRTRSVESTRSTVSGHGIAAAAGLAVDATPDLAWGGVSLGARVGVDWLRYAATDSTGAAYAASDAASVSAQAVAAAFLVLYGPLRVTFDVAAGGALHGVAVEEDGQRLSRQGGVGLSGALGLALGY